MQKTVIVINGSGGVGKDTLCDIAADRFSVWNISSIDPIKELAAITGWNGDKSDRSRKFLADLKQLTVTYNDYPLRWLMARYETFLTDEHDILFVHIREPKEIEKFVKAIEAVDGKILTLLVRGGERLKNSRGDKAYGNAADDEVEQYAYDCYYTNDRPLEETKVAFAALLQEWLEK